MKAGNLLIFGDHDEDGTLDTDVFADAASQAQAWIQSFCAPRFGATVIAGWDTATPTLIVHTSDILTIYFLAELGAARLTEQLKSAYSIRIEQLEQIRDGKIDIVDTDGEILTPSQTQSKPILVSTSDDNRVFTTEGFGSLPNGEFPTVFGNIIDSDGDPEIRG